ncbi:inorganic phosphate transporter [Paracoccus laeviglucosivorans]|uniref:Phosphate transporter n=1 Tax=Paracoccus laeviglucosivorans TaxID=1197861 RepID=A0A521AVC1_9RHOB|nr:inorganic phosphate transporter [Paracoccus laeviglucosivorans]SMO38520.1 inorganic phosphate transporter, PiT family [Paracoccus laeviglucosivorans]
MPQKDPQYRILDKDLGRLSNAEHARVVSGQPVLRLGIALVFMAVMAIFASATVAGQPATGLMAASIAVALYLALSIGANDVANSLSPAVGAGAIGLVAGLCLVAVVEVAGALLASGPVARTLMQGLIGNAYHTGGPTANLMLAALAGAATCISIATWLNAPISTTHSIVGAIAGAGVAVYGLTSVNWPALAFVAMGWVASPIVSALLAAGLLSSMHRNILDKDDPITAGRSWLTLMIGATTAILALFGGLAYGKPNWALVALTGLGAALLAAGYTYHRLGQQIAQGEKGDSDGIALKHLLGLPLIVTAVIMGFGHGANSSAKVAAPLTTILTSIDGDGPLLLSPLVVLGLAGLGIAMGVILFGGRLVQMVGTRITQLNPARGFCVTLAAALTVLAFSMLGLPVSTTHISVGGVFGVGLYRELRDRRKAKKRAPLPEEEVERRQLVRWSYVRRILGAWLVTVPVNAVVAGLLASLIGP